jgi:hypothetical protein
MEKRPLLLSRPGMGMKVVTWYKKADDGDMGHQALQQQAAGGEGGDAGEEPGAASQVIAA